MSSCVYVWGSSPLVAPEPGTVIASPAGAEVWVFNQPSLDDWSTAMLAYTGQTLRVAQCDWPLPASTGLTGDAAPARAYDAVPALDEMLINDYLQLIGREALASSAQLLADLIPGYLQELARLYHIGDALAFGRSAHTLKGACASVGLKRLQQLAEKLQHAQAPVSQQLPVLAELLTVIGRDLARLKTRLAPPSPDHR